MHMNEMRGHNGFSNYVYKLALLALQLLGYKNLCVQWMHFNLRVRYSNILTKCGINAYQPENLKAAVNSNTIVLWGRTKKNVIKLILGYII